MSVGRRPGGLRNHLLRDLVSCWRLVAPGDLERISRSARALVWFTGVLTGPGTEYGSLVRALARASGMVHDSGQRPGRQVWCRCVGGGPGGVGCALVRAAARAGVDGSRVCGAQKNSRESLDSRLIPNYLPVFPSVSVAPILPTLTP